MPLNQDLFTSNSAPIYRQFETNPLYPDELEILKNHFIVKKSDINKLGWCEQRFFVHDLAVKLVEEGYVPIKYTDKLLQEDLENFKNEDLSHYQQTVIRFSTFSHKPPSGRRLILHFMLMEAKNFWDFYQLYLTINDLIHDDITREDIIYYTSRRKRQELIRHPAFYRALFKQWFDVKDKTIYDLCPDVGYKALATMIEGGHYYCDSPQMDKLENLANFIGGKVSRPNQSQYDLVILSDIHPVDINSVHSLIANFRGVGKDLMITVKKEDWRVLVDRYKPWRVLRVNNEMIDDPNSDNYILIIKS